MTVHAEEIRQFLYCKRIPFLRFNFGKMVTTYSMKKGQTYHEEKTRRNYQFKDSKTLYNQYVESKQLGILAKPDAIIISENHLITIENKRYLMSSPSIGVVLQALAGGVCAAEQFQLPLKEIWIIGYNGRKICIKPTSVLRIQLEKIVKELAESLHSPLPPEPTPHRKKCEACEYAIVCGRV